MRTGTDLRRWCAMVAAAAILTIGGLGATASAQSPTECSGAVTTVYDEAGVLQQACVDQAAETPAMASAIVASSPARPVVKAAVPAIDAVAQRLPTAHVHPAADSAGASSGDLPETGTGTWVGIAIGAALVAAGSATSLLARRRHSR
ncbi:MAG: LPXTG cell wall anchor domain-containing protein [Ilumatobacteraceae bacterium]